MANFELQIFEPSFEDGMDPNSFPSVQAYRAAQNQWADMYGTQPPVEGRLTKPPAGSTGNFPVVFVWYKFPRQLVIRMEGASVNAANMLQAMQMVQSMEFKVWALPPRVFMGNGSDIPSSGIVIGNMATAPPTIMQPQIPTPTTPVDSPSSGSKSSVLKWALIGAAAFIIFK